MGMQTMEHRFHNCKDYYIILFEDFKSIPQKKPVFVIARPETSPQNRQSSTGRDIGQNRRIRAGTMRRQATVRVGS